MCQDIADIIGCRLSQIYAIAAKYHFKKSIEYNKMMGYNEKFRQVANKSYFKKNHLPFNKGKKMDEYVNPESIERIKGSQFKKGVKIWNEKADGLISIRKDSRNIQYQWIRLSKSNWKMLHVYKWEQINGNVPDGHLLIFQDKNPMNCNVENLLLITKAENMIRNTIHHYPEDLKQTIRTLTKLKKTINGKK